MLLTSPPFLGVLPPPKTKAVDDVLPELPKKVVSFVPPGVRVAGPAPGKAGKGVEVKVSRVDPRMYGVGGRYRDALVAPVWAYERA